jgi:oxygen-independent coproporphyrinogen-3 oxidase
MILEVQGNLKLYYAQMLCMIYFPDADFSANQTITDETPYVKFHAISDADNVTVSVTIKSGGKTASSDVSMEYGVSYDEEKAIKIAAGKAILAAGKDIFDYEPPWGILTGVRPSKIAMELYGKSIETDRIKQIYMSDYLVTPRKCELVTDIANSERKIIADLPENSCSVYISIPFCPSRCSYCSFISFATDRLISLIPEYIEQLLNDIAEMFETIKRLNQKVVTVYIGGGTPTILNDYLLEKLLSKVADHLDFSLLKEYTIEAGRPDTITAEKLKIIKKYGVNRICINPQTLNDSILQNIGRSHSTADFYRAFDLTREIGIKNINTDLIAGLPGDSLDSFSNTVDNILKLRPENVMYHTFCVKKSADLKINNSDNIYSIYGGYVNDCVDYAQNVTKSEGYHPFYIYRQKNTIGNLENVGYALDGADGKYNIFIIEEIHNIFAAGAGAVTKIVSPDKEQKIKRFFNHKYPYEYLSVKKKQSYGDIYEYCINNTEDKCDAKNNGGL